MFWTYRLFAFYFFALLLIGCSDGINPKEGDIIRTSTEKSPLEGPTLWEPKKAEVEFATPEEIQSVTEGHGRTMDQYLIGEGDFITVNVWNHPETSAKSAVAPDGMITVPHAGHVKVAGLTRIDAENQIKDRLLRFYQDVDITFSIDEYRNNKAYVLGAVRAPGIVNFPGEGRLIEAITLAGGIPHLGETDYPVEVSILRGKSEILWIDVNDLLQGGNLSLNARIFPNDIVYIPPPEARYVYVMGEVQNRRAIPLTRGMSMYDAIMLAGGPTEDAKLQEVYLIRWDGKNPLVKRVNMASAITCGDFSENFALKDRDVIYLEQRKIASFNYIIRQLTPTMHFMNLTRSTFDNVSNTNNNNNN
jgi:polysaccharide export outer membrane protein